MSRQRAISFSAAATSSGVRNPFAPLTMRIEFLDSSSTKIGATPLVASVDMT
jgi:hypothetical protein